MSGFPCSTSPEVHPGRPCGGSAHFLSFRVVQFHTGALCVPCVWTPVQPVALRESADHGVLASVLLHTCLGWPGGDGGHCAAVSWAACRPRRRSMCSPGWGSWCPEMGGGRCGVNDGSACPAALRGRTRGSDTSGSEDLTGSLKWPVVRRHLSKWSKQQLAGGRLKSEVAGPLCRVSFGGPGCGSGAGVSSQFPGDAASSPDAALWDPQNSCIRFSPRPHPAPCQRHWGRGLSGFAPQSRGLVQTRCLCRVVSPVCLSYVL